MKYQLLTDPVSDQLLIHHLRWWSVYVSVDELLSYMYQLLISCAVFRTLAEFWHWFVANIPGDSLDDGEVVFDLLFPLVLPEGDGDHR